MTFHRPFGSAIPVRALALSLLAHAFILLQGGYGPVQVRQTLCLDVRLSPVTVRPPPTAAADLLPAAARASPVSRARSQVAATAPAIERQDGTAAITTVGQSSPAMENGDGARSYRLAIAGALRRVRRGAHGAAGNGESRLVRLVLTIGQTGKLRSLRVVESGGRTDLDETAMAMLEAAVPFADLPDQLRGREFSMELGIELTP